MSEVVYRVFSGIQTVEDMIAAFSDEQQCRRLFEAMVWPKGRICPACGYKSSIAIAGRDMVKTEGKAGALPMFKRRLPVSIYRDHQHASAFHQAAVEHMAQGSVVDPPIGQRPFLGAAGRGAWREPANGLADGPRTAVNGGTRNAPRRHGRD
jgi:hypothetical protein